MFRKRDAAMECEKSRTPKGDRKEAQSRESLGPQ
jgi:hypothetical protein